MEEQKPVENEIAEKQRLFQEIGRALLEEERPSLALKRLSRAPAFHAHPCSMLLRMKRTGQSPRHHPEGSVWNHTLLVVDEAAKRRRRSKDEAAFLWAALLHDIGKPDTTRRRNGRFTAYGHDELGARLAEEFLREFGCDEAFVGRVKALVRWHMQPLFVVKEMPFADIETMKRETDVREVALLSLCDRLGRLHADRAEEERKIERFLEQCGL